MTTNKVVKEELLADSLGWKAMPEPYKTKARTEITQYFKGIAGDRSGHYYGLAAIERARKWVTDVEQVPRHELHFMSKSSSFTGAYFAALIGSLANAPIDTVMYRIYCSRILNPERRWFFINPMNFNEDLLKSDMVHPIMGLYSRYGTGKERRILYAYVELPHLVGTTVETPKPYNGGFGDNCGASYSVFTPKHYVENDIFNSFHGIRANLFFLWDVGEPNGYPRNQTWLTKRVWSGTVKGKEMVVLLSGAREAIWSEDGTVK